MGAKDVLNRFPGHVTAKRDNAASFMASLPGAPGSTMESSQPLSQDQLKKLYRTNWIARKVCDLYAADMVSAGVEWDIDTDTTELLEKEFRRLQVWGALEQAVKLARLYGGSIILMGTAAPDPMKPLNTGEALLGLRVFDRYEAKPDTGHLVATGARLGEPQSYDITPVITTQGIKADESRCLRFIGAALPASLAKAQDLWGDSVLQAMKNRIEVFDGATEGVGELMKRCNLRFLGIKGFWEAMGDETGAASDQIAKAIGMVNQMQTIYGLTVTDAADTYSTQSYSFGGVKDVLDQISQQLAGACDIPLVRLYGMSPAGFSTGESDLKSYCSAILKSQESMLRGPIARIAKQILTANNKDAEAEALDFKFAPLMQPTQAEKATTAQQGVATILQVHSEGLISDNRALEEVRRLSAITGIFSTVDQADVDALKMADVPVPTPDENNALNQPATVTPPAQPDGTV